MSIKRKLSREYRSIARELECGACLILCWISYSRNKIGYSLFMTVMIAHPICLLLGIRNDIQRLVRHVRQKVPNYRFTFVLEKEELERPDLSMHLRMCSICLNEYKPGEIVRNMACSHRYHATCIDQWLDVGSTCPVCRASPV